MHCNPIKISERFIKKKEGQLFKMASLVSSMASCPTPKRAKSGVRHHLQLSLGSQAMKEAFLARLDARVNTEGGSGWVPETRRYLVWAWPASLSEIGSLGHNA